MDYFPKPTFSFFYSQKFDKVLRTLSWWNFFKEIFKSFGRFRFSAGFLFGLNPFYQCFIYMLNKRLRNKERKKNYDLEKNYISEYGSELPKDFRQNYFCDLQHWRK
jgi:hypothetical protein